MRWSKEEKRWGCRRSSPSLYRDEEEQVRGPPACLFSELVPRVGTGSAVTAGFHLLRVEPLLDIYFIYKVFIHDPFGK